MLPAGIAEADDEEQRLLPAGIARIALGAVAALLGGGRLALLADELGLLLDGGLGLFLDAGGRESGDRDLVEVLGDEFDALGGGDGRERHGVVDLHLRDVGDQPLGNLGRQRFDGGLAGDVLEHAALFDARRRLGALELDRDLGLDRLVELHFLQVDVLEQPLDRVQLLLLDHDWYGFRTLDLEVEERLAAGQHGADLAFARLEGARILATGVDDAGNELLAAQAAGAARAEIGARSGLEFFAGASHANGEDTEIVADDAKIPKGRLRRSAKLGSVVGVQGARYAGTKAANVARSEEGGKEKLEQRHLETAMKMVGALGQMKGAAMKLGQFASFIDTEFLPEEYSEIYQEQLAKLRTSAPPMPWEKVEKVLDEEWDGEPVSELFASFEQEAFAAASIGQVHRAEMLDGRRVAVKIQYPGIAEALDADLRNAGTIVRLARALAPGLDAKAIAHEIRERVMEELDYEYEAQNQRSFARAYRDHPFIYVPEVITRLSRRRVLVTELVEGMDFEQIKQLPHEERSRFGEIIFRGNLGSMFNLQHFNADPHPGNYILMDDGRVAFLDFGMTKKLDREQIVLEQRAFDAASRDDPEGFREALHDLGFIKNPSKLDAERLMDHMGAVGGWYVEDREIEITPKRVMKIIESTNDPRSEYYDLMRRESIPADELMGRRMEIGVVAVLGQLRAKRNWHRIMREWVYADPPATELGEQEWEYFEGRGIKRVPGLAEKL
jgi:predicted unusual protein kinase regulating ubiquinone biosynthesis (AarF/ABC1/UbiB family)